MLTSGTPPLAGLARVGRPKAADTLVLTPRMEEYAQLIRRGYDPEGAALKMGINIDRAFDYHGNPAVIQRVKYLYGDKMGLIEGLHDELLISLLETAIRLTKAQKIPWVTVERLLERLSPFIEDKKQKTEAKEEIEYDEVERVGSIFKARVVKTITKQSG